MVFSRFFSRKEDESAEVILPKGHIKIGNASTLFDTNANSKLLASIRDLVALPDEVFGAYYQPVLDNYAEFVQQLPASRAHHHANKGGLLTHTLEVVYFGMRKKNSYILPPNTAPENVAENEQRWIYGVFLSCMLHDIGKPMSDMLCIVYDENNQPLGRWSPIMGSMTSLNNAHSYEIKFAPKSHYEHHGELTLLLMSKLVPAKIIDWLQRDLELFHTLLRALNGQHVTNNTLKDIVKFADSESTSRNLGATGVVSEDRVDQSALGLQDKILTTIKYLLTETTNLKFNKPGAIGFVKENHIYFVSKKFVDLLRDTMTRQGIVGVPSDNSRMFDIMQEHSIIIESARKKATWPIQVVLTDSDWEHVLTMVKVPLGNLGLTEDEWPEEMAGHLVFEQRDIDSSAASSPEPEKQAESKANTSEQEPAQQKVKSATEQNSVKEQSEPEANKSPEQESTSKPEPVKADEVGTKKTVDKVKTNERNEIANTGKSMKVRRGEYFVKWLRTAIADKKITFNSTRSMIHIVSDEKYVLLVSPALFKHVLTLESEREKLAELDIVDLSASGSLTKLQKGFFELKHHTMNPETQRMITPVIVQGGKSNKISQLNGILVKDWSLFFASEPAKNAKLSLLTD